MFNDKIKLWIVSLVLIGSSILVYTKDINLGLDLQGGIRLILEAQDTDNYVADRDAVMGVVGVIRSRVDALGVSEPVIQRKGERQIIVELPGIDDPERAIRLIGETALLEFVEAEWAPDVELTESDIKTLAGENARIDYVKSFDNKGNLIRKSPIFLKDSVMTGNDLKWAGPGTNEFGQPIVSLEFTKEGAAKFYTVSAKNVGKPLVILLDGKIISAPNINEPIAGGRAQISGSFSIKDMQDMVIKLKAGSLPVPVKILENKIIGPTLGQDAIAKSKVAAIIGFLIVMVFMVVYYKLPGIIAVFALGMYGLFDYAALIAMNATLTLPGIAGLILTIGMAVDANVIIFEKLKEELRSGKTIINAIEVSFKRAFVTIVDANLTTIIGSVVLFWLGTGSIKGFAVTLISGIVVSMFTAVFVSRLLLIGAAKIGLLTQKSARS